MDYRSVLFLPPSTDYFVSLKKELLQEDDGEDTLAPPGEELAVVFDDESEKKGEEENEEENEEEPQVVINIYEPNSLGEATRVVEAYHPLLVVANDPNQCYKFIRHQKENVSKGLIKTILVTPEELEEGRHIKLERAGLTDYVKGHTPNKTHLHKIDLHLKSLEAKDKPDDVLRLERGVTDPLGNKGEFNVSSGEKYELFLKFIDQLYDAFQKVDDALTEFEEDLEVGKLALYPEALSELKSMADALEKEDIAQFFQLGINFPEMYGHIEKEAILDNLVACFSSFNEVIRILPGRMEANPQLQLKALLRNPFLDRLEKVLNLSQNPLAEAYKPLFDFFRSLQETDESEGPAKEGPSS